MSRKDGKGGDVSSLHERILNPSVQRKPAATDVLDDVAVDIPMPGSGGRGEADPVALGPVYAGEEPAGGSGGDVDYGDVAVAGEGEAETPKKGLTPRQRLVVLLTTVGLVGALIFNGTTKFFSPDQAVPELAPSPLAEPPPPTDLAAPDFEGEAPELQPLADAGAPPAEPLPAADGNTQTATASDAAAVPPPPADQTNPFAALAPSASAPAATPDAPAAAAAATPPATPPAVPAAPPAAASPQIPAPPQAAIPPPTVAAPSAPPAAQEPVPEARIKKLEKQVASVAATVRKHDKILAAGSATFSDTRPDILVKWVASAARNCAECRPKALVVAAGKSVYVADGDTLSGYKVRIEGDRVILSNAKSSYSYYPGQTNI